MSFIYHEGDFQDFEDLRESLELFKRYQVPYSSLASLAQDLNELAERHTLSLRCYYSAENEAIEIAPRGQYSAKEIYFSNFIQSLHLQLGPLRRSFDSRLDFFLLAEEILSLLPFPIAILSRPSEIHWHNEHFRRLGILPRECFHLLLGQKINRNKKSFLVHHVSYQIEKKEFLIFFFFPQSKKGLGQFQRKESKQATELGIISSSMAHELKNPLSGILAALEMLALELGPRLGEERESEDQKILLEMKETIKRCMNLVEVFLGISRPEIDTERPHNHRSLEESIDGAMKLLIDRMTELKLTIRLEKHLNGEQNKNFHLGIYTMIFYLTLGHILNLESKMGLLESSYDEGPAIKRSLDLVLELNEEGDLSIFWDAKFQRFFPELDLPPLVYTLCKIVKRSPQRAISARGTCDGLSFVRCT